MHGILASIFRVGWGPLTLMLVFLGRTLMLVFLGRGLLCLGLARLGALMLVLPGGGPLCFVLGVTMPVPHFASSHGVLCKAWRLLSTTSTRPAAGGGAPPYGESKVSTWVPWRLMNFAGRHVDGSGRGPGLARFAFSTGGKM